jgi:glycosyltransferase involved in cell wall biosynthesis
VRYHRVVSAPLVSVIVPNYNHARFLPKRIDSILAQTCQDFELILLDDCSTDESRAILQRYSSDPRVHLEFNQANSGSTFKQWNKGVHLAHGKYVWIAESDDYADASLLATLLALLEQDDAIAFAYCRSWRVPDVDRVDGLGDWYLELLDPHLWQSDFVADGREHCRKYFARMAVVCNSGAAVFRKSCYDEVGGADETLRLCGDWKFWAAMALTGKVAFSSRRLNYFRHHATNVRTRATEDASDVIEKLGVIRWILDRTAPDKSDLLNAQREASNLWVPAMLSFRIPSPVKSQILALARQIDSHPIRRFARPAFQAVQRKFVRHWTGSARYAAPKSA